MPTWRSGRPTRKYGWGRESHPNVREGSGGPPRGLGGVGSFSQRALRGQEALPEGQERSGGPSTGLGRVCRPTRRSGRPTWTAGKGRKAHPQVRRGQEAYPEVWERLGDPT